MKYKIEINCDNQAFELDWEGEVIRILQSLIDSNLSKCKLFDINGNSVGFAKSIDRS